MGAARATGGDVTATVNVREHGRELALRCARALQLVAPMRKEGLALCRADAPVEEVALSAKQVALDFVQAATGLEGVHFGLLTFVSPTPTEFIDAAALLLDGIQSLERAYTAASRVHELLSGESQDTAVLAAAGGLLEQLRTQSSDAFCAVEAATYILIRFAELGSPPATPARAEGAVSALQLVDRLDRACRLLPTFLLSQRVADEELGDVRDRIELLADASPPYALLLSYLWAVAVAIFNTQRERLTRALTQRQVK